VRRRCGEGRRAWGVRPLRPCRGRGAGAECGTAVEGPGRGARAGDGAPVTGRRPGRARWQAAEESARLSPGRLRRLRKRRDRRARWRRRCVIFTPELDAKICGAELRSTSAPRQLPRQPWAQVSIMPRHGAELCYLGATVYSAEYGVQSCK
jgi:hypothetical protein